MERQLIEAKKLREISEFKKHYRDLNAKKEKQALNKDLEESEHLYKLNGKLFQYEPSENRSSDKKSNSDKDDEELKVDEVDQKSASQYYRMVNTTAPLLPLYPNWLRSINLNTSNHGLEIKK